MSCRLPLFSSLRPSRTADSSLHGRLRRPAFLSRGHYADLRLPRHHDELPSLARGDPLPHPRLVCRPHRHSLSRSASLEAMETRDYTHSPLSRQPIRKLSAIVFFPIPHLHHPMGHQLPSSRAESRDGSSHAVDHPCYDCRPAWPTLVVQNHFQGRTEAKEIFHSPGLLLIDLPHPRCYLAHPLVQSFL